MPPRASARSPDSMTRGAHPIKRRGLARLACLHRASRLDHARLIKRLFARSGRRQSASMTMTAEKTLDLVGTGCSQKR